MSTVLPAFLKTCYGSEYCDTDVVVLFPKMDGLHQLLEAGGKRERLITPIELYGLFYDEKVLEVPEFEKAIEKLSWRGSIKNESIFVSILSRMS